MISGQNQKLLVRQRRGEYKVKKEFFKLSLTLCAITLVAALLLAAVNNITKEKIELSEKQAMESAMESILSEADSFEQVNDNVTKGLKNGGVVGYCVNVYPKGFGGEISMIVGINNDRTVAGIDILSHSETAGLGAKADTDDFKNRFKGKNTDISIVKTDTDSDGEVKVITGATITSKAIADGIREALSLVQETEGGVK